MCGIIGSINSQEKFNSKQRVLEQYENQKSRGQDGFGFIAIEDGKIHLSRSKTEKGIKASLDKLKNPELILFHHRIPTSSPNVPAANHPIFIRDKKLLKNKYFLIHNGHISNSFDLRKEHEAMGFTYHTPIQMKYWEKDPETIERFTDTESLAIELALHIETDKPFEAEGGIAAMMLQVDLENNPIALFVYRNSSNPMNFYTNQSGIFFSSVGKGQKVEDNTLLRIDLKSRLISSAPLYQDYAGFSMVPISDPDEPNETDSDDSLSDRVVVSPRRMGFGPSYYGPNEKTIRRVNEALEMVKPENNVAIENRLAKLYDQLTDLEIEKDTYMDEGKPRLGHETQVQALEVDIRELSEQISGYERRRATISES